MDACISICGYVTVFAAGDIPGVVTAKSIDARSTAVQLVSTTFVNGTTFRVLSVAAFVVACIFNMMAFAIDVISIAGCAQVFAAFVVLIACSVVAATFVASAIKIGAVVFKCIAGTIEICVHTFTSIAKTTTTSLSGYAFASFQSSRVTSDSTIRCNAKK